MNELIHLGQGEQKLHPIIKFKTYNRGLFQIYKTGSYLMRGVLLITIIIILFSDPTCNNNNNNNNNNNDNDNNHNNNKPVETVETVELLSPRETETSIKILITFLYRL